MVPPVEGWSSVCGGYTSGKRNSFTGGQEFFLEVLKLIKLTESLQYTGGGGDKIISVHTLVYLSPIYFSEFYNICINRQVLLYKEDKKHCSFILQIS